MWQLLSLSTQLALSQTLLTAEMMFSTWFIQQLDKSLREKQMAELDLDRVRLKIQQEKNKIPEPLESQKGELDVHKILLSRLATETEKNKLIETEKNKLSQVCADAPQESENRI